MLGYATPSGKDIALPIGPVPAHIGDEMTAIGMSNGFVNHTVVRSGE